MRRKAFHRFLGVLVLICLSAMPLLPQVVSNGTTANPSSVWDFSAALSLKVPSSSGAAPTVDGWISFDTALHNLVWGSNGITRTAATKSGATVGGNCAKWDVNANLVDSGGACGGISSVQGSGAILSSGGTSPAISCPTCVTAAAVLSNLNIVAGAGSQASQVTNITTDAGLNNLTVPGSISTSNGTVPGEDRLFELTANGTNYVSWLAPGNLAATTAYQMPSSPPSSAQLLVGTVPVSGLSTTSWGSLSGDVTSNGLVTALATVNSSPGTCGDATHVCQVTTNGKGLVTGQSAIAITGGGSGGALEVNGSALAGSTANLNGGTPPAPAGSQAVTFQVDSGSPTTNISAYVSGLVPRPASQRRSGGFFANSNSGFNADKGYADHFLSSPTATSGAETSLQPYRTTVVTTGTGTNSLASVSGDLTWRRNSALPNNLHVETRLTISSVTGDRAAFCYTSNAVSAQMASVSPAGDYFCLEFDSATNGGKWLCVSAAAGTTTTTDSSTTVDTNPHLVQLDFIGADASATATVDGVSVCGNVTATLPTSGVFLRALLAVDNLSSGSAISLNIGPFYVEGGSN